MSEMMKAVVAHGPHDYRYEDVELPEIGESDILLEVTMCGICAGDLKAWEGAARFWGGQGWDPYVEPPCIPGHEFFGRIVKIGEKSPYKGKLEVGDRVTPEQVVPCGECKYCRDGNYWMCDPHNVFGFKKYLNGGFAPYVVLPANALIYKVPDCISDEEAVLIEPFACAWHAIDRAQIKPGDIVVQSGAGPLGLAMVAAAKLRNPGKLIVLDLRDGRLEQAKRMGADIVLNPQKDNVAEVIASLTDGYGCDIYIEATGHPSSVEQGLGLIRKLGRFVEFSVFSKPATVDWSIIGDGKELDICGVSLSPGGFEPVIAGFADGTLKHEGVLTHVFPLEQFEEAFKACALPDAIKVALRP